MELSDILGHGVVALMNIDTFFLFHHISIPTACTAAYVCVFAPLHHDAIFIITIGTISLTNSIRES